VSDHEAGDVVDALSDLCAKMKVKTLVHVGAGDGYEAFTVAERTDCRAIAIDGDTRMQPFSPKLEFHHILIGATDCEMPFYVNPKECLSSPLPRGTKNEKSIGVQQQRLDTFCARRGNLMPDGLIIDTEGTSLDVLEGCGDLLDNMKIIYAEVQTNIDRPGMRLVREVDSLLVGRGMEGHGGPPSYNVGSQGNMTWVRK